MDYDSRRMKEYRLREDLNRAVVNGYVMPLGLEPGDLGAPEPGYTIAYTPGEDEEPDSYSFHVTVSHDRLRPLLHRAFELLPQKLTPIVEVESTDAYRTVDVYLGSEPIGKAEFLDSWTWFEPFLLEDCYIGAGANSEEPFVEVFLDQWKRLSIHVPLSMRDAVEEILAAFDLEEAPELWPGGEDDESFNTAVFRSVLEVADEYSPDLDEMIHELRRAWRLELNVDPERNADESGRELGLTLWHAVAIVQGVDGDPDHGAYASAWITAGSLSEVGELLLDALEDAPAWRFAEIYTVDRVAYDDRPDELGALPPRRERAELHRIVFESWSTPPEEVAGD